MNWDQVKTNYPQLREHIKGKFDKLSDDDITSIKDNFRDHLCARLVSRYGYTKEVALQKLDEFVNTLKVPAKV